MPAMDVAVQLRLLDQLSGPASQAAASLEKIRRAIGGVSGEADHAVAGLNKIARAQEHLAAVSEKAAARMTAAKGKALAALAGLFSLAGPMKGVADEQQGLISLAQINEWGDKVEGAYKRVGKGMALSAEGQAKLNEV